MERTEENRARSTTLLQYHRLKEAITIVIQCRHSTCFIMKPIAKWRVKLFADSARLSEMLALSANPLIKGFTTNPTLMRRAGVLSYEDFARTVLSKIPDRPVSLEVFADDFLEMERQAHKISSWGTNVYVKVPVTNTKAEPSTRLLRRLSREGVKLNVTALMTV